MPSPTNNLNKPAAIVILLLIAGFIAASGYYFFSTNTNTAPLANTTTNQSADETLMSTNMDTSDWVPYPYFGDDIRFYAFIPPTWVSPSLDSIYNDGGYEGSFLWFTSNFGVGAQNEVGYAVGRYQDTGQDLETWTALKAKEIESARTVPVTFKRYEKNGIPMVELCSNGTVSGTPAPACYVYMRQAPWIIELRIEAFNSSRFAEVQQYAGIYSSNFHFFGGTAGWSEYSSFNNGFRLRYPADDLPLETFPAHFVASFNKGNGASIFQVITNYGSTADLEKYWYEVQKNEVILDTKLPNEISLDGQRCFMYPMKNQDTEEVYTVMCTVNNRLYKVELMPGSDAGALSEMLNILSTYQFTEDYVVDSEVNAFREGTLFELEYPNTYTAYEEGSADGTYLGFHEYLTMGGISRGFSVTYQETSLSPEQCAADGNCMLYSNDLSQFDSVTFKKVPALKRIYEEEYQGQMTSFTNYVLNKDGRIYSININTVGDSGNEKVEAMLDSFTFL